QPTFWSRTTAALSSWSPLTYLVRSSSIPTSAASAIVPRRPPPSESTFRQRPFRQRPFWLRTMADRASLHESAHRLASRVRLVFQLQLGQRLGLFVLIDLLWFGQCVLTALLAGEWAERWIYLGGALGSVLL